ncbi:MAG: cytochrome c oxidase assembly protein [Caulobacteraceae bacterium]
MIGNAALTGYRFAPYCGAPPSVDGLWGRWNLDPALLACLIAMLAAYVLFSRSRPRLEPWRRRCFVAGWALGTAALVSPLCALSVSLFSARVGQHMLLTCVVAPLIALGLPPTARRREPNQFLAAVAFAAALWFWHAPGPYAATFDGPAAYWAMHLTLFGAALLFWRAVLDAPAERMAAAVAASLATGLQMAFLGALITFASAPLYAPHALTAWAWGLTPLADQQLGGTIMWVPAGLIFVAAILASLAAVLARAAREGAGREDLPDAAR